MPDRKRPGNTLDALWDGQHKDAAWMRHPYASAPFTVSRVVRPTVLWWNTRWFVGQGIDTQGRDAQRDIHEWLIRHFAWMVASDDAKDAIDGTYRSLALADRYGETGRSPQGGSGRVATLGGFQVKGIGRTPLVGQYADAHHANGCAFVEEAIREAIFAEVAGREFPHGAIPVIAIIDIDAHHVDTGERRALIVRPACKRLAHLQRAPAFFPCDSDVRSAQLADAKRTRDFIHRYGMCHTSLQHTLEHTLSRVGEQVAHGQAYRLFHGGYFTSNISIDGALLDYGSMRSVDNWAAVQVIPHSPGFGAELFLLEAGIDSVAMHVDKYLGGTLDRRRIGTAMRNAHGRHWRQQLLHLFSIPADTPAAESLLAEINAMFAMQNAERVDVWRGQRSVQPPIHHLLANQPGLWAYYSAHPAAYRRALRRLAPRPELDRERLQNTIFRSVAPRCSRVLPSTHDVTAFIEDTAGRATAMR